MHQVGNHFHNPRGGGVGVGGQMPICPQLGPQPPHGPHHRGCLKDSNCTRGRDKQPPGPQKLARVAVGLGKPARPTATQDAPPHLTPAQGAHSTLRGAGGEVGGGWAPHSAWGQPGRATERSFSFEGTEDLCFHALLLTQHHAGLG